MSLRDTHDMSIVWQWADGSYDRVHLRESSQGWTVSGRHADIRYVIQLDQNDCCQSLEVTRETTALTLNRSKSGWFCAGSKLVQGSAKCHDLDLGWTAMTNTFPIKRLTASDQSTGTFPVIMVSEPDFDARVVEQSYTRLYGGWLYQNNESGYSTSLTVDQRGIVTDYPGLCTRKDLGL